MRPSSLPRSLRSTPRGRPDSAPDVVGAEREVDLDGPVRDFLVAQGWAVRGEVGGCDVAGRQGRRSRDRRAQAVPDGRPACPGGEPAARDRLRVRRGAPAAHAGPRTAAARAAPGAAPAGAGAARGRCRGRLGRGAAAADPDRPRPPRAAPHPGPAGRDRGAIRGRDARRHALAPPDDRVSRDGRPCRGCARWFGPLKPAELRAMGTGPRTLATLRDNVYGWFERVDRGIYRLTSTGAAGILEWPAAAARKAALLPGSLGTARASAEAVGRSAVTHVDREPDAHEGIDPSCTRSALMAASPPGRPARRVDPSLDSGAPCVARREGPATSLDYSDAWLRPARGPERRARGSREQVLI